MKGSIEKNFKAMVSVWYTQEVNDWRCYLWCDHKETDHQEIVECGILPPVDQKSNGVTSVPWQVQVNHKLGKPLSIFSVPYPFVLQILEETPLGHEMICTGVLISQDVVLTSAHCFTQCPDRAMDEKKYGVVLGKTYLRVPGDNLLVTGIEEITVTLQNLRSFLFAQSHELFSSDPSQLLSLRVPTSSLRSSSRQVVSERGEGDAHLSARENGNHEGR